jgi:heme/copper-type cytochrome/quinol oxidase subunit 3
MGAADTPESLTGRVNATFRWRLPMIVECSAIFWHLVDLLWILLFALFDLADGHG